MCAQNDGSDISPGLSRHTTAQSSIKRVARGFLKAIYLTTHGSAGLGYAAKYLPTRENQMLTRFSMALPTPLSLFFFYLSEEILSIHASVQVCVLNSLWGILTTFVFFMVSFWVG